MTKARGELVKGIHLHILGRRKDQSVFPSDMRSIVLWIGRHREEDNEVPAIGMEIAQALIADQ